MAVPDILPCLHCGRVNNAHDGPSPEDRPSPGDISICWGCQAIAIYTENGARLPTQEELGELLQRQEVRTAINAMRESYTPREALELRRQMGGGS